MLAITGCGWFNPANELWDMEPEYITVNKIAFGTELDTVVIHLYNNSEHHRKNQSVKYSIQENEPWIDVVSSANGILDNEELVSFAVNRSKLVEGVNNGEIKITIDNKDYLLDASAIGLADLVLSTDNLDMGTSSVQKNISVFSIIGNKRYFNLTTNTTWLDVEPKRMVLSENRSGEGENVKQISIVCRRGSLPVGRHTGYVSIISDGESYKKDITVTLVIPEKDSTNQTIDDFTFSFSKAPYRNGNGVVIELLIKNESTIFRMVEFNSNGSVAIDAMGNRYRVKSYGNTYILPDEEATREITIENVPDSISSLERIQLDFGLSESVLFENVSL